MTLISGTSERVMTRTLDVRKMACTFLNGTVTFIWGRPHWYVYDVKND